MAGGIEFETVIPYTNPIDDEYSYQSLETVERGRGTPIVGYGESRVLEFDRENPDRQAMATAMVGGGVAMAAEYRGEEPHEVAVLMAHHREVTDPAEVADYARRAVEEHIRAGWMLQRAVLLAPVHDDDRPPEGAPPREVLMPGAERTVSGFRQALGQPAVKDIVIAKFVPEHVINWRAGTNTAVGTMLAEFRTDGEQVAAGIYVQSVLWTDTYPPPSS